MAGCTDLFPATPGQTLRGPVLDLTAIAGLRGIARDGAGWRIGATTTWAEIARADLPPAFDGLRAAAREVGAVQIQNAGTLGGNLEISPGATFVSNGGYAVASNAILANAGTFVAGAIQDRELLLSVGILAVGAHGPVGEIELA